MKVAIVCEGRLAGEDAQVFEHFAKRIAPGAAVKTFPQGTKPELFSKAGEVAKTLFTTGYNKVLIIWDILPRWEKPDGEAQDRLDLLPSLVNAGVATHPCLFLIAIHKELEAWLLADGTALSAVLSRPAHPVAIAHTKNADTVANPKKRLEQLFEQHNVPFGPQPMQGAYQPKLAAIRIAEQIPANFGQLGKLGSFKKFGHSLIKVC
ncbi:hypothetical protein [Rhodoferax sp.]|uniref:hypothetical protein n=1 Tax=Rhodoferax sp. TaxID=50421 RepID=UPI002632E054|nr:hypothetical protein [Rhodoferax sp.]MDD5478944.1 hypothetical protein [Rhodoferax sp.]